MDAERLLHAGLLLAAMAAVPALVFVALRSGSGRADHIWRRMFWTALAATTTGRLVIAGAVPPFGDETYYFHWSLHPQLCYFDHPPLMAWAMSVAGLVFGHTVWTIRFWPVIAGVVFVLVGRALARDLFGQPAADRAGFLLAVAPAFAGNGVLMTPDTFFLPLWAGALYCTWRALQGTGSFSPWWLAAGLCTGVGGLSKYAMALYFAGLAVLWVAAPDSRRKIVVGGALCAAVALAVFTPVLVWNSRNGWESILFQLGHGLGSFSKRGVFDTFGSYVGGLFLIVTPFLFVLCAVSSYRGLTGSDARRQFAAAFFLAVVTVFAFSSTRKSVEANWPMPGFVSGIILVAADWERYRAWLRHVTIVVEAGSTVVVGVLLLLFALFPTPLAGLKVLTPKMSEIVGGPELAQAVRRARAESGIDVVCTANHQLFGRILYYAPDLEPTTYVTVNGPSRFPWVDTSAWQGKPVLILTINRNPNISEEFTNIQTLPTPEIKCEGGPVFRTIRFSKAIAPNHPW